MLEYSKLVKIRIVNIGYIGHEELTIEDELSILDSLIISKAFKGEL